MFTGIVEELGVVEALADQGDAVRLTVRGPHVTVDAHLGDSLAVNGCCLTVAERDGETFTADVMRETLDKTSLGALEPGGRVNLERAVTAQSRLAGHIRRGAGATWSGRGRPSGGARATSCRGTWTAPGPSYDDRSRRTGRSWRSRCRPTSPATWSPRGRSPWTGCR